MKKGDLVTYVSKTKKLKGVKNYKEREEMVVCKDVEPRDSRVWVKQKSNKDEDCVGVEVLLVYLELMKKDDGDK